MMPSLDLLSLQSAIPAWLSVVLEASMKGTLILFAAALGAKILSRASAAARHFLWCTALGSLLVLPLLSLALPSWRVPVLPPRREARPEMPAPDAIASIAPVADASGSRAGMRAIGVTSNADALSNEPSQLTRSFSASATTSFDAPAAISIESGPPSAESDAPSFAPRSLTWTSALVLLWLLGVVVVLLPVAIGVARVRWLVRRSHPADARAWRDLAEELAPAMGIARAVRILESDAHAMPMTFGTLHPVILVPAGAEAWPEGRRRDVLLHELAHVQRHDALTQRIAQLTCAIHWMNPFVWGAAARLHAERERACDDQVINAGAKAADYARHLLDVARTLRAVRATSAAAMAMARPSQLEGRLLAVLDARISRRGVPLRLAARGWMVAACLVLPLAAFRPAPSIDVAGEGTLRNGPFGSRRDAYAAAKQLPPPPASDAAPVVVTETTLAPSSREPAADAPAPVVEPIPSDASSSIAAGAEPCWRRQEKNSSHSNWVQDDGRNRRWTVRWGGGRCRVEMEAEGKIEFNADLTDVASLSPGGSFDLREIDGDAERRLEIMADGGGALTRRYWVNGREQPFDADGRAWLGGMLIELERMSAFAADTRVPQLLAAKGVGGVLDEIALMRGDHAKKVYFQALFKLSPPKGADLERAVREAGRAVRSDYELAEILIGLASEGLVDRSIQAAYVDAIGSVDSDYERRRALTPLLQQPKLDPAVAPALFKSATAIKSDYELAQLLLDISSRFAVDEKTRPDFFLAVSSIASDYEQRRVLAALLKQKALGPPIIGDVLTSAMKIDSDYEQAELLIQIAETQNLDGSMDDAFFRAVNTVGSDYEHARILKTLLERERLSKGSLTALLRSSAEIDSDYEAAEVLTMVAGKYPLDESLKQEYMKAADSVGSEYDYGRVMAALRKRTASQN
jgi:beta-lactamase regulating signal transducer with metallopeptidase domain